MPSLPPTVAEVGKESMPTRGPTEHPSGPAAGAGGDEMNSKLVNSQSHQPGAAA